MTLDEVVIIEGDNRRREESIRSAELAEHETGEAVIVAHEATIPQWARPGDELTAFDGGQVIIAGQIGEIEPRGARLAFTVDCPQ